MKSELWILNSFVFLGWFHKRIESWCTRRRLSTTFIARHWDWRIWFSIVARVVCYRRQNIWWSLIFLKNTLILLFKKHHSIIHFHLIRTHCWLVCWKRPCIRRQNERRDLVRPNWSKQFTFSPIFWMKWQI